MEIWLYIIGFFPLIALIGWIADNFHNAKLYSKLKPRLDNLDAKEAGLAVLLTQGEPTQQNDSGESGGARGRDPYGTTIGRSMPAGASRELSGISSETRVRPHARRGGRQPTPG